MRISNLIPAAALLLLLSGCATLSNPAETTYPGTPEGWVMSEDPGSGKPEVQWIRDGEKFALVTWGSSTCPWTATEMKTDGDSQLTITLVESTKQQCTMDFAPTTNVFSLPADTTGRPVTVSVVMGEGGETSALTLD